MFRTCNAHELISAGFLYFGQKPHHSLALSFFEAALGLKYRDSTAQSFYRAAMCAPSRIKSESSKAITSNVIDHLCQLLEVKAVPGMTSIPE